MEHGALVVEEHHSVKENLFDVDHHLALAILSVAPAVGDNNLKMMNAWTAVEMRYSYGELSMVAAVAAALVVHMHCQGHC